MHFDVTKGIITSLEYLIQHFLKVLKIIIENLLQKELALNSVYKHLNI